MTFVLICPSISPLHPPAEIDAWIAELRASRERFVEPEDPEALDCYDRAIETAEQWLAGARGEDTTQWRKEVAE